MRSHSGSLLESRSYASIGEFSISGVAIGSRGGAVNRMVVVFGCSGIKGDDDCVDGTLETGPFATVFSLSLSEN